MDLPSKESMLDSQSRPYTQSLFLETGYADSAVYTLKDNHYEYKGRIYPSIKKLYLECADPTEYEFAIQYLYSWSHWKRITENRVLRRYVNEWRDELEVKLRSQGVKAAIHQASLGSFQSAKWLADRGWDTRGAGRPSKADVERETKIQAAIKDEFSADIIRLLPGAK